MSGTSLTAGALIALRSAPEPARNGAQPVSALPGGFVIRKRGQGQTVADSRIYTPGDDLRHVDRGATARTGELHVRRFHEERDQVSFLVADFRPSMLWGMRRAFRSVAAAEALAMIGWRAVDAGGRVGLMAITAKDHVIIRSRGGVRGMLAVIGGLVRAHEAALAGGLDEEPALDEALEGLSRVAPRGAGVIIASALDHAGPEFGAVLGGLSRQRNPRFLLIGEGALESLPGGEYPLRTSDGLRRAGRYQGGGELPRPAFLNGFEVTAIDAGLPPQIALGAGG